MNAAGCEYNSFNRLATQLLNVRVKRDQREADDDSDHQTTDIL
jgi:hypothetical protein